MNKKILYGLTIIMVFLTCSAVSAQDTPHPFTTGDSFSFNLSNLVLSSKVNGTEYAPAVNTSAFTNPSTVTVTGKNATTVFLVSQQNGTNQTSYSGIDDFTSFLLLSGLLLLGFNYTTPSTADFSAPDNSSIISLSPSTSNESSYYFPMFASGNVTYYQSLINTSETSQGLGGTDPNYSYSTNTLAAQNSGTNNTYTLSFDAGFSKSNASEQFQASVNISFKAVIDLQRDILTELDYSLSYAVSLGSASESIQLGYTITEANGTTTTGLPGFGLLSVFAFASVTSALVIIKKRRKQT